MAQASLTELVLTTNDIAELDVQMSDGFIVRLGSFEVSPMPYRKNGQQFVSYQLGWWGGNRFDISEELADVIAYKMSFFKKTMLGGEPIYAEAVSLLREFSQSLTYYAIEEEYWIWKSWNGYGNLPVNLNPDHGSKYHHLLDKYVMPHWTILLAMVEVGQIITFPKY